MHVTAIIAAGGIGRRLGAGVPKQILDLGGRSILQHSLDAFTGHDRITDVIVVLPNDRPSASPVIPVFGRDVRVVAGGARRQDSVARGFAAVPEAAEVVVVHDAARPFVSADLISRSIDAAAAHGAAIAAIPAQDTVKRVARTGGEAVITATVPRDEVYLAQTPQAFRRDVLAAAVALGQSGVDATDEAMLAERAGHPVHVVEGDPANVKITTMDDLARARRGLHQGAETARVGTGYDLHRLVEGRPLILGGVTVPAERGALGHSDADVVCHAATDAILGAATLGDIGSHFPDHDMAWKGASSVDLLRRAVDLVHRAGYRVVNLDVVIVLERPKIAPHLGRIRETVAGVLEIPVEQVSVKGKTNEGMDAVGRGEAIAAHAVALLTRQP